MIAYCRLMKQSLLSMKRLNSLLLSTDFLLKSPDISSIIQVSLLLILYFPDPENIEANFRDYLNGFSANVQDVLAKFDFDNVIKRMVEKVENVISL